MTSLAESSTFDAIGNTFLRYFIELGGLQPEESVLDVGCGLGRMAIPLTGHLSERGRYRGIDIGREAIASCQRNITGKHPHFQFEVADVYNQAYNPRGAHKASEYQFPYPDGTFDFVYLVSVFTHMLPLEVRNYTAEVARVLKPGGRCLITYFLLNPQSRELIDAGRSSFGFPHQHGEYWVMNERVPEEAVAYEESFIREVYAQIGLSIDEPIRYGCWCGREEFLDFQDILIARKEGTRASPAEPRSQD
jgi:SAM-dependent methyltransferase